MKNEFMIEIENLGKRYILGQHLHNKNLRENISNTFKQLATFSGNKGKHYKNELWAVKDVSFNVKKGERIGIIGANGAGKSTILKLISRITEPTEGKITMHGRVASLLEVGTGFHGELTGKENIYLNGSILGMSKKEINKKFKEIVEFAGVEHFLETPVKRYSSGMYVRLAFSVAAHLEPEILIVDEVLAVGDVEFQNKCLGKMRDVASRGRTVLFVSHNMSAVSSLCEKTVLLNKGKLEAIGQTNKIIEKYLHLGNSGFGEIVWENGIGDEYVKIFAARVLNFEGMQSNSLDIQKPFFIEFEYEYFSEKPSLRMGFRLTNSSGVIVLTSQDNDDNPRRSSKKGYHKKKVMLPPDFFNQGTYFITVGADIPHKKICFYKENCISFSLEHTGGVGGYIKDGRLGVIKPLLKWV